jgi:hypothetical protein
MDVTVNVGLGTGQEDIKLATINQTLQTQMMIYSQYGPSNGLVTLTQIRNSLADLLALGGYRNAERYFSPMSPEIEQQIIQQMMQQQQAAAQQQTDPNQAFLQVEQMKAQMRQQTDMAKMQAQQQTDAAKIQAQQAAKMAELQFRRQGDLEQMQVDQMQARADDDYRRDMMHQQLMLDAAKIAGQQGTAVDIARIRAMQQANRDEQGNI